MLVQAERRITFCAGHRVVGHENKCKNMHGHNWELWVTCETEKLDSVGRVKDFGFMKEIFGGWIDEHWDHGMILWSKDPAASLFLLYFNEMKLYLLSSNPTAENLAQFLLGCFNNLLLVRDYPDVIVTKIVLFETENCKVTVTK